MYQFSERFVIIFLLNCAVRAPRARRGQSSKKLMTNIVELLLLKSFQLYVHLSVTILVTISFELSLQTAFYTFFSYFSFRVSLCHLLFNFWMGGNQLGNTAVIRGLQLVVRYGSTGCGVFKRGVQNQNQHTQRKLLNFENWINGRVSKIGHHFRK